MKMDELRARPSFPLRAPLDSRLLSQGATEHSALPFEAAGGVPEHHSSVAAPRFGSAQAEQRGGGHCPTQPQQRIAASASFAGGAGGSASSTPSGSHASGSAAAPMPLLKRPSPQSHSQSQGQSQGGEAANSTHGQVGLPQSQVQQHRKQQRQQQQQQQQQQQLSQIQPCHTSPLPPPCPLDSPFPALRRRDVGLPCAGYGDRFIPSRTASCWASMRLWEAECDAPHGPGTEGDGAESAGTGSLGGRGAGRGRWGAENGDDSMAAAYSMLLKAELLGLTVPQPPHSASRLLAPSLAPGTGPGPGLAWSASHLLLPHGTSSVPDAAVRGGYVEGQAPQGATAARPAGMSGAELASAPGAGATGDASGVMPEAPLGTGAGAGEEERAGVGAVAGAETLGGAGPWVPGDMGLGVAGGNRNMLRFVRVPGAHPDVSRPGAEGGSSNSVASWLGPCTSPLALSPLSYDCDALSSSSSSPSLSALQSAGYQRRKQRKIARSPYKVLDAPALQDDFYLNLVDWSSQNVLAVGLGSCCYLWSAVSSKVTKLCDVGPSDSVCSVSWTHQGAFLAVGTSNGDVQVWDVVKARKVRSLGGHRTRVGAMSWSTASLATGSRDHSILLRDIRDPHDFSLRLSAHRSEVCGLKWSPDERELASGGNDNQLLVWSAASSLSQQPLLRFHQHSAAVKAIAWSPHQHGLLASGGGTADRCIRFWNTSTGANLAWVDSGSQVCNLAWSQNANELVSTHGYSLNQIVVWRYPSMSKLATLTGHTMRVLFLALSPDGQTIVTGAGDETLRFWNVFPGSRANMSSRESVLSSTRWCSIR